MFSLICVWINGWVNNRGAGDLRRHLGHYDVIVMCEFLMGCSLSFPKLIHVCAGTHHFDWYRMIWPTLNKERAIQTSNEDDFSLKDWKFKLSEENCTITLFYMYLKMLWNRFVQNCSLNKVSNKDGCIYIKTNFNKIIFPRFHFHTLCEVISLMGSVVFENKTKQANVLHPDAAAPLASK